MEGSVSQWREQMHSLDQQLADLVQCRVLLGAPSFGEGLTTTLVAHVLDADWLDQLLVEVWPNLVRGRVELFLHDETCEADEQSDDVRELVHVLGRDHVAEWFDVALSR